MIDFVVGKHKAFQIDPRQFIKSLHSFGSDHIFNYFTFGLLDAIYFRLVQPSVFFSH